MRTCCNEWFSMGDRSSEIFFLKRLFTQLDESPREFRTTPITSWFRRPRSGSRLSVFFPPSHSFFYTIFILPPLSDNATISYSRGITFDCFFCSFFFLVSRDIVLWLVDVASRNGSTTRARDYRPPRSDGNRQPIDARPVSLPSFRCHRKVNHCEYFTFYPTV